MHNMTIQFEKHVTKCLCYQHLGAGLLWVWKQVGCGLWYGYKRLGFCASKWRSSEYWHKIAHRLFTQGCFFLNIKSNVKSEPSKYTCTCTCNLTNTACMYFVHTCTKYCCRSELSSTFVPSPLVPSIISAAEASSSETKTLIVFVTWVSGSEARSTNKEATSSRSITSADDVTWKIQKSKINILLFHI